MTRLKTKFPAFGLLIAATLGALVVGLGSPAIARAAHSSGYGMTSGRLGATVAGLVGLGGLVTAVLALRARGRDGNGKHPSALVALVLGLTSIAGGGLVVASADGGIGTGIGLGGGVVALALGLTAVVLSGLAQARSRRIDRKRRS